MRSTTQWTIALLVILNALPHLIASPAHAQSRTIKLEHVPWNAAMAPNGKFLVTISKDPEPRADIYDLATGKWAAQLDGFSGESHEERLIVGTDVSPDSKRILVGSANGRWKIWTRQDSGQWEVSKTGRIDIKGTAVTIRSVRFLDQERFALTIGTLIDSELWIWESPEDTAPRTITFRDPYPIFEPIPKSSRICMVGVNGLMVYDYATELPVYRLESKLGLPTISADGKLAAIGYSKIFFSGGCGDIRVWDCETGKNLHTVASDQDGFASIALSRTGEFLAFSSQVRGEDTVTIYNLQTNECLAAIPCETTFVKLLYLSSEDTLLIVGRKDIQFWDMQGKLPPPKADAG